MVETISQEKKSEPLQERGEKTSFDTTGVKPENTSEFPPELIHDSQENLSDEQRQNLWQKIFKMGTPEKFRLAILGNREARNLLIHNPNKIISLAVLRNPKVNEGEILQYAQRRDLSNDVISAIAKDHKWQKNYQIKFSLASNPKTPLSLAINILPHLQEKDLKSLSRAKDVSSALSRIALHAYLKRSGK